MPRPPEPRTDAELIAACRGGDLQAFDQLYARHRDWVASVALRFSGRHQADALDVLQDTFAYLIRRIPELELEHQLRSLLYPVIKHLARDTHKRNQRLRPLEDAPEEVAMPGLTDSAQDLIALLGPLQQEIITLRYIDQLSLREIAEALVIPLGTVKSRLHKALGQLKEKLGDE